MKDSLPRYTVRINRELLYKLERVAKFNGRTKNEEIEFMLKSFVKNYEMEHGEIPWKKSGK